MLGISRRLMSGSFETRQAMISHAKASDLSVELSESKESCCLTSLHWFHGDLFPAVKHCSGVRF